MSNNEDLEIVGDEPDSSHGVLEIDMESFSSVIQSNLNNHPLYCYGDSDCMDRRRRSDISKSANMTGQDLSDSWGIPNPAYAKEESRVTVTVIHYTKRDISPQDMSEVMELNTEICYCLRGKRRMKRLAFDLETPYGTIHALAVL